MRASVLLARSACRLKDGTLDLVGAGLFSIGLGDGFVVVSFIEIPFELADVDHTVRVELIGATGDPVGKPLTKAKRIRTTRSALASVISTTESFEHRAGTYEVRLSIDSMSDDAWRCGFQIRR